MKMALLMASNIFRNCFIRVQWFGDDKHGCHLVVFETENRASQGLHKVGGEYLGVGVTGSNLYQLHVEAGSRPPMRRLRAASALTWIYAAGFGLPAIPVAVYLVRNGRLPSFFGLFDVYGGPWSAATAPTTFAVLLVIFFGVTGLTAWAARMLWKGSRTGAVLLLALLVANAVFWIGFALPIPWLVGAAIVLLIVLGWIEMRPEQENVP